MMTRTCPKCQRPALELHHVRGYPGEYCVECKPAAAPYRDPFVEVVNGIVIGDILTRYEFWSTDNRTRLAQCEAATDAEAEQWFRSTHPEHYANGAIMRCYEG